MMFGGIEAGGTKMVCAVGKEDGTILDRVTFPTRQPEETFSDLIGYFKKWDIKALGIGCFGPVDLNRESETYGYITKTPKRGGKTAILSVHLKKRWGYRLDLIRM